VSFSRSKLESVVKKLAGVVENSKKTKTPAGCIDKLVLVRLVGIRLGGQK